MSDNQTKIFEINETQKNQLQQAIGKLLKEKMSLQQSLKQQEVQAESEREELFLELLEVFDALEFFLDYLEENPELNPKFIKRLPKSIGTIQKKLLKILERREVQSIELQDDKPDYSICQVVDHEEREDLAEQAIVKVVRQGFTVKSKLLRPVEVIAAKKPSSSL
ncbi:MAG: nucleotide exchange factor GrpE [Cyanobacteria bacterium P01_G01_bin.19]